MKVTFGRDVNMIYTPSLAPWRHRRVLVCTQPGTPLPAGTPLVIDDELAYTAWHDFKLMSPPLDPVFEDMPDSADLVWQQRIAVLNAPHVAGVAVDLPEE